MPRYDGECEKCGRLEIIQRMRDEWPNQCPLCNRKGFAKCFNTDFAVKPPPDMFWENENSGRGRYISQLQMEPGKAHSDKNAFCRSQGEAIEKAKRLGFRVTRTR